MEKWDLYDKNRNKLNKIVDRGSVLSDDEYHLVVNGWVKNDKDEFLITQRAPHKSFPYMWECTGGSAVSGETSLEAVAREVKEELGDEGRILLRKSGTEPVVRVMVEAATDEICERHVNKVVEVLSKCGHVMPD